MNVVDVLARPQLNLKGFKNITKISTGTTDLTVFDLWTRKPYLHCFSYTFLIVAPYDSTLDVVTMLPGGVLEVSEKFDTYIVSMTLAQIKETLLVSSENKFCRCVLNQIQTHIETDGVLLFRNRRKIRVDDLTWRL